MISKKDATDFPFLKEASNLAKEMELETDMNTVYSNPEACQDVNEYLTEVYHNKFFNHLTFMSFPLSRNRFLGACAVINQTGKEGIMHRFAEYEAGHFALKVENRSKEMFPVYFNMVFEEVFGRPPGFIKKTEDGKFYAVKVTDFLKFKRKKPEYSPVCNRRLRHHQQGDADAYPSGRP